MAAHSKIVDEEEAIRWFREGIPYSEFVRRYEEKYGITTSQSMWSAWRRRKRLARRLVRDDALIPWAVMPEHRWDINLRHLREEARRRAGVPLSDEEASALASWLERLAEENAVVYYDPENGFRLVPRLPEDTDIVREPPPELMTDRRPL